MIKNSDSKIAITFGDQKVTYSALKSYIKFLSGNFRLEAGRHAVIYAENCLEWIYALYAIWDKEGVAIPIDNMATAEETAYILSDSLPEVVFTTRSRQSVLMKALSIANINASLIILDDLKFDTASLREVTGFHVPEKSSTAVIIYTSGTTGSPKGVMLSYENLLANVRAVSEHIPIYKPSSVVMMLLPVHHIFPLAGTIIIPLYVGSTVAISPSMQSADIMETLQKNQVTIIIGVPRLYAAIRKGIVDKIKQSAAANLLFQIAGKLQSRKYSKKIFKAVHDKLGGAVEYLVSGGAALDKEVGTDFQTLGFEVLEGYGMTEAAPMITFTQPGRVKIGSPGEIMRETNVEIRDGEITASGPNIMKGYYNNPVETAEILKDGWLYTGDMGYIDKDGYLIITGRKKEIIVLSNGKNVNPAELEEKLIDSPYVKECGIFYFDEQLQAIIVPDYPAIHDHSVDTYEFIKWQVIEPFNKTVSSYKKILGFHITDGELPRTRLGKLQRFKLPSLALLSDLQEENFADEETTTEFNVIAQYLEQEKSKKVMPRHHLEMDLGMDSLDLVSFQAWLFQTFGVDLDPAQIATFNNIGDLTSYVRDHKIRMEESKFDWTDIIREKVNLKLPTNWMAGRWMIKLSKIALHLYFRIRAKGLHNIPAGPVIFVPNHQSSFDALFVAAFLRRQLLKKTYFYAKEKHFRQAWLKFLADRNNIIIVDLNKDLKESIQKMAEVLRQNRNLIIFPEGTRTKTGEIGEFKKTFAILSTELNIPVVPVSIKGAFEALPSGSKFPKPWKQISVEFLKPVYPENFSYDSLTEHVRNKIHHIHMHQNRVS